MVSRKSLKVETKVEVQPTHLIKKERKDSKNSRDEIKMEAEVRPFQQEVSNHQPKEPHQQSLGKHKDL